MEPEYFGAEQVTEKDRAHRGSRFAEVRDAVFANPVPEGLGRRRRAGVADLRSHARRRPAGGGAIQPVVPLSPGSRQSCRFPCRFALGADRKGFRRIIHPNGICLTGLWEISEPTPYSGYFRKDSRALLVPRYSTCCRETRRGRTRSLSMVGKLFPTTDPNHGEPLHAASFITQQDLRGDDAR